MKLDIDTFLSSLALFSGTGAGMIVGFNALLYGLMQGNVEPRPTEMIVALLLFTICIGSLMLKAIFN